MRRTPVISKPHLHFLESGLTKKQDIPFAMFVVTSLNSSGTAWFQSCIFSLQAQDRPRADIQCSGQPLGHQVHDMAYCGSEPYLADSLVPILHLHPASPGQLGSVEDSCTVGGHRRHSSLGFHVGPGVEETIYLQAQLILHAATSIPV